MSKSDDSDLLNMVYLQQSEKQITKQGFIAVLTLGEYDPQICQH